MTPFYGKNRVTSGYRLAARPNHYGIDVTNPYGDWKVREVTGGKVTNIYTNSARGLVLEVTTAAGDVERYQHLKQTLTAVGQSVPQGTVLAVAGNTGDCQGTARADNEYMAGRHLHFEVLRKGIIMNPVAWLGLPNVLADYSSNDNLDGNGQESQEGSADGTTGTTPEGAAKSITITGPEGVGFISSGDVAKIEECAKALGLPVAVKEA